jgi:hypothetical protein
MDAPNKVRRKDGRVFVSRPEVQSVSPFAVQGMDLGVTTKEIAQFVRERCRAYDEKWLARQTDGAAVPKRDASELPPKQAIIPVI